MKIPILRRCSGGGTVLQGPGCLNYALVLRIMESGPTRTISAANQFIMERNRVAIASLLGGDEAAVEVRGHTDLALDGLKFSGNSQRRRKHFLLFHGTLLLNFDLGLIAKLLPPPSREPDYRGGRPHEKFLTNLPVSAAALKSTLRQAWAAHDAADKLPGLETQRLVVEKYSRAEWNLKF
jgi:lipoate-protein ligase A